jgi:large subunit ribosomal protein L30e
MVDVDKILKNISNKGNIRVGVKETKQMITKGSAKLVIIASNSPYKEDISNLANEKGVPVYNYPNSSVDLGYACGRNHAVSTLCVLDKLDRDLRQLLEKGKNNA